MSIYEVIDGDTGTITLTRGEFASPRDAFKSVRSEFSRSNYPADCGPEVETSAKVYEITYCEIMEREERELVEEFRMVLR